MVCKRSRLNTMRLRVATDPNLGFQTDISVRHAPNTLPAFRDPHHENARAHASEQVHIFCDPPKQKLLMGVI